MSERTCGFEFHVGHGRKTIDSADRDIDIADTCETHLSPLAETKARESFIGSRALCCAGVTAAVGAGIWQPRHMRGRRRVVRPGETILPSSNGSPRAAKRTSAAHDR